MVGCLAICRESTNLPALQDVGDLEDGTIPSAHLGRKQPSSQRSLFGANSQVDFNPRWIELTKRIVSLGQSTTHSTHFLHLCKIRGMREIQLAPASSIGWHAKRAEARKSLSDLERLPKDRRRCLRFGSRPAGRRAAGRESNLRSSRMVKKRSDLNAGPRSKLEEKRLRPLANLKNHKNMRPRHFR